MKKKTHKGRKGCFALGTLLLLTAFGFLMMTNGYDFFMKKVYPLEYKEIVEKEAKENGVEQALVYAVIKAESNFNPNAVSHAGAVGLMQITPPTFEWLQTKLESERELTEEDLLDPATNIRYGCKMLSILLQQYPEKKTAICAYNAGIGRVNGWLQDASVSPDGINLINIPYAETDKYSTAVLKNYEIYHNLYQF